MVKQLWCNNPRWIPHTYPVTENNNVNCYTFNKYNPNQNDFWLNNVEEKSGPGNLDSLQHGLSRVTRLTGRSACEHADDVNIPICKTTVDSYILKVLIMTKMTLISTLCSVSKFQ